MNDLVPPEFYLGQNYPNPFKDKTTIKHCVAFKTKIRITIYNSEAEMIYKLVDEVKEAGTYEVVFSVSEREKGGNQAFGIRHQESEIKNLVSFLLFYQMKAGDYLSEKEMRLVR